MAKTTINLTEQQQKKFVNAKMDFKLKSVQQLLIRGAELYISQGGDRPRQAAKAKNISPAEFNSEDLERLRRLMLWRGSSNAHARQAAKFVEGFLDDPVFDSDSKDINPAEAPETKE